MIDKYLRALESGDINDRADALAAITDVMKCRSYVLTKTGEHYDLVEVDDFNPEKVDTAWEIRNGYLCLKYKERKMK